MIDASKIKAVFITPEGYALLMQDGSRQNVTEAEGKELAETLNRLDPRPPSMILHDAANCSKCRKPLTVGGRYPVTIDARGRLLKYFCTEECLPK